MTVSCLYTGTVMHRRFKPKQHRLSYRVFWALIDLDELPQLDKQLRLFSHGRFNLFGFYNRDHGDGSATPLRAQVEGESVERGVSAEHDLGESHGQRASDVPRREGFGERVANLAERRAREVGEGVDAVNRGFGQRLCGGRGQGLREQLGLVPDRDRSLRGPRKAKHERVELIGERAT